MCEREREIHTILRGRSARCSAAAAGAGAGRTAEGSPAGGIPEADTPARTPAAGTPASGTPVADRRPSRTLIITQKQLHQKPSKPQKFKNEFEREIATLGRRDANGWLLLVVVAHLSLFFFSPAAEIPVEEAPIPSTERELGNGRLYRKRERAGGR